MSAHTIPPLDQELIERRIRALFTHSDITDVAIHAARHRTTLSRQLNPEEPMKSDVFSLLELLRGCRLGGHQGLEADVWSEVCYWREQIASMGGAKPELKAPDEIQAAYLTLLRLEVSEPKGSVIDRQRAARTLKDCISRYERELVEEDESRWDEYGPSRTGSRALKVAGGGREIP